jgi:hypothetical protein
LLVVAVSVAIVALLAAAGGAATGYVVIHRDHGRIERLQREVKSLQSLCNRRVVTQVTPSLDNFTVHTAQGCGP